MAIVLIICQNSFAWSARIAVGRRIAQGRE
jgi:hypothetical protein